MEPFVALQDKMIEGHSQLKQLAAQQRLKERSVKECSLVSEQISTLSPDIKLFKSNGRAYFLTPKEEVLVQLKKTKEDSEKEVEKLKAGQTKVEGELKEAEQNMKELLNSNPELVSQIVSNSS